MTAKRPLLKDLSGQVLESADECECGGKIEVRVIVGYRCVQCGFSGRDIAGWEYADKDIVLFGKRYPLYKVRSNVTRCANCGKIIIFTPIMLFSNSYELNLCVNCAYEMGIFRLCRNFDGLSRVPG